jgi:hypothetical protein
MSIWIPTFHYNRQNSELEPINGNGAGKKEKHRAPARQKRKGKKGKEREREREKRKKEGKRPKGGKSWGKRAQTGEKRYKKCVNETVSTATTEEYCKINQFIKRTVKRSTLFFCTWRKRAIKKQKQSTSFGK